VMEETNQKPTGNVGTSRQPSIPIAGVGEAACRDADVIQASFTKALASPQSTSKDSYSLQSLLY
jgi:hypothetical protein